MNTHADFLRKLGLSQTETTLYMVLLRIGASDVQKLIEETGLYKANAYNALERLYERGLISKIIEGNKRVYQIQKPESLIEYLQKKKSDLEQQEMIVKKLVKDVQIVQKHAYLRETAMVFRGLSGIRQIYSEIVNEKVDYLVFGSPSESETLIGEYYWKNLHLKQKNYKIKAKMIFHRSLKHWKKIVPEGLVELRFFDDKFEPLTETTIYGNKVAFVIWTEKPTIIIINDEHIANSYRQIFRILWKSSKK